MCTYNAFSIDEYEYNNKKNLVIVSNIMFNFLIKYNHAYRAYLNRCPSIRILRVYIPYKFNTFITWTGLLTINSPNESSSP